MEVVGRDRGDAERMGAPGGNGVSEFREKDRLNGGKATGWNVSGPDRGLAFGLSAAGERNDAGSKSAAARIEEFEEPDEDEQEDMVSRREREEPGRRLNSLENVSGAPNDRSCLLPITPPRDGELCTEENGVTYGLARGVPLCLCERVPRKVTSSSGSVVTSTSSPFVWGRPSNMADVKAAVDA